MRYFKNKKIILLVCLAVLGGLMASCSPSNIDATGSGGVIGPTTPTPSIITVNLSPTTINPPPGTTTVTATVTDAFSNPLSGITVNFSASDLTAGTFSAASATTDAAGVATVTYTANAGVNTIISITATVLLTGGGAINNSASLIIGAPVSTPSNLTITITPLTVNIMAQATVTVTAVTSTGTPAYNTNITLDIPTGATLGSFSSTADVDTLTLTTDSSGQVTATFYAGGTSGTVTIRATSVSVPTVTRSASLTITSDPSSVTLNASSTNITTSGTTTLTASVANILGNDVSDGTTVTFAITAGNTSAGTFSSTTATTVLGDASVTFTASSSITGSIVITATAGSVSGSVLITISAANTGSIEFVSATPQVIGIVGSGVQDYSIVIFLVKDTSGNPKSGATVNFTLYGPTGASLQNASGSTGTDGKVQTILQAGMVAGPARIVAAVPATSISTSSGNISIGGGVPSATHFDLSTNKYNLEGLASNNVQATITAYIADRFGNYNILTGTSVSFVTDSGAIDTSSVTDATGIATSVFRTQAPRPADVAPILGEPYYTYGGRTYNPRDGWATILVYTTGEETFVDETANGVYDLASAEPFTDLDEPFIDSDDDGVRDAGEQFFDWPAGVSGNTIATYDLGNGEWDAQIPIWGKVNLVFTGSPSIGSTALGILTSRIECTDGTIAPLLYGDVTILKGATTIFYVYASDVNMNTMVSGTSISVATTKGTLSGVTSYTTPDVLSYGPTILTVYLKNEITETTAQTAILSANIVWKGVTTTIFYPGTITLTP